MGVPVKISVNMSTLKKLPAIQESENKSSTSEKKEEQQQEQPKTRKSTSKNKRPTNFSIPKFKRTSTINQKSRASTNHKVDYNSHAPEHNKHYFSCACDIRINERIRKQRIEFSNDLHDIVVCMPSALDALKFEVLVGSKIDPVARTTDDQLENRERESMTIQQQDRVEALMSDERDLSISRT